MKDSTANIIQIMGKDGICKGKYKSGQRKGQPCKQKGVIRLNTMAFCGMHIKSELINDGKHNGLSIEELKGLAVDKHLACESCSLKYHTKVVNPWLYRSFLYYVTDGDEDGMDRPIDESATQQVCSSCYKDIVSCDDCSKEATHPDPYEQVETPGKIHRFAYCEKHHLELRKEAYRCNYMDCEDDVTNPHPDKEEQALFYCEAHYEQVKNRTFEDRDETEGIVLEVIISNLEGQLISALEGRAGDIIAEKVAAVLKQDTD